MRISCSQWRFSLSPIYERKTWKKLNIEIQNFISIFVFRYSPAWRFCAQICTIANVLIANIMFAVGVLTLTHLRKKNLENFEYRNTGFYFDFSFTIFGHLTFLCSLRISCSQRRCSSSHIYERKTLQNLNEQIPNFDLMFVFRHSDTLRFCAQNQLYYSFLITRSSHRCVWYGFEPRSGHM